MSEIILETNRGFEFLRDYTKNRCRVRVKHIASGSIAMTYRFNRTDYQFSSPYISWDNLNCCGGWDFDETYLLTAVQEEKKLCSGMIFYSEQEQQSYINTIDTEKYSYFCREPMHNGPHSFFYVDLVRDGAIHEFIDSDAIIGFYDALGFKQYDMKLLKALLTMPMYYMISGETFDYRNPVRPEEWISTGLLLGYPIESTVSLLEQ